MNKKLEELLKPSFDNLGYDSSYVSVVKSNRPELCDFQINSVFSISKELGKNPKEIGESLVEEIKKIVNLDNYISKVEFVMPGF